MGAQFVLVTGTHEPTPEVVNTLYGEGGVVRSDSWARLPGSYHGPAARSRRRSPRCSRTARPAEAVREAQDYTWHALKKAYRPGMGQFLPDRLFWAREDDATPGDDAERERASDAQSRH
jgi:hydroxymethylpyrimidine/phosphomethylpyrimidine kinase